LKKNKKLTDSTIKSSLSTCPIIEFSIKKSIVDIVVINRIIYTIMKVEIKKIDGLKLTGKDNSGHEIVIDTKKELGGHNSGISPMKLLLLSLGSCTLMDVISLCDKMRVNYEDMIVKVKGERLDKHPKIFKSIEVKYLVYGKDPDESKIKKAIDLSTKKYCSIHAMLGKSTAISSSLEIIKRK